MKILVLTSSGNKHGSSNMLAEAFARGAQEARHTVTEYDVQRADIRPCTGCGGCGTPEMTKRSGYVEEAYALGRSL